MRSTSDARSTRIRHSANLSAWRPKLLKGCARICHRRVASVRTVRCFARGKPRAKHRAARQFIHPDAAGAIDALPRCRTLRHTLGAVPLHSERQGHSKSVAMGYLEFLAPGAAPAPAQPFPDGALCWSDVSCWDGAVPPRGARIHIEAGRTIVLDQDIDVASLEIEGTL